MSNLLDLVKRSQMRDDIPDMNPGDTVRVHARIVEGNKERVQVYEGVIISIRRGQNSSTVTVRRTSHAGIGVERTFLLHSPRIDRFEIVRRGRVRRAKLYYLRSRQGKSARIKERRPSRQALEAARAAAAAPARAVAASEPIVAAPEAAAAAPATDVAAASDVPAEAVGETMTSAAATEAAQPAETVDAVAPAATADAVTPAGTAE